MPQTKLCPIAKQLFPCTVFLHFFLSKLHRHIYLHLNSGNTLGDMRRDSEHLHKCILIAKLYVYFQSLDISNSISLLLMQFSEFISGLLHSLNSSIVCDSCNSDCMHVQSTWPEWCIHECSVRIPAHASQVSICTLVDPAYSSTVQREC